MPYIIQEIQFLSILSRDVNRKSQDSIIYLKTLSMINIPVQEIIFVSFFSFSIDPFLSWIYLNNLS